MKKYILTLGFVLLFTLLTACNKSTGKITESTSPTQETTEAVGPKETSTPSKPELTIADYFPLRANVNYIYEGKGNEYASYNLITDYIKDDRVQVRSNNGGTELVEVIEYKDGKLTKVFSKGEVYYRENFIANTEGEPEILLQEPLVKGTEWTLPDKRRRYISNEAVEIETPYGTFQALEVTTEGKDGTVLDYYAMDIGLVKTVYSDGTNEVTSTLSDIKENVPFTQTIRFYYPNVDKDAIYYEDKEISFYTNDITREKIEEAVKNLTESDYEPVISPNTKIKSLYLNKDNIVYVDFSKEFVSEMNAGTSYESAILQCITNTLGNYYNVKEVYITIEGKPYESGHILMKKGETFKVNMDNVQER